MLGGKHALVTGGGTGIGRAIAVALAEQGACVTIAGRRADVLDNLRDDRIHPLVLDVRDPEAVTAKVAEVSDRHGPIQICVANAGVLKHRPFHRLSLDDWRATMATNLDGAFLTIQAAMRSMRLTDWGRVITVASLSGRQGLSNGAAYAASKQGLVGLTRALSEEYLGSPYTFNALCPGPVDTPMAEHKLRKPGVAALDALNEIAEENRHSRLLSPSEVAAAALWLCGPGSDSVNGQSIDLTGGPA